MKKTILLGAITALLFTGNIYAQFEGYISQSAGFHSNPLYNYMKNGDQLKETYLELKYSKEKVNSVFNLSYIGGLTLFNKISDRNYYQHTLSGAYKFKYLKNAKPAIVSTPTVSNPEAAKNYMDKKEKGRNEQTKIEVSDSLSVNDSTMEEAETDSTVENGDADIDDDDFTGQIYNALTIGASLNARHDKPDHEEYDNYGISLTASYDILTAENSNYNFKNETVFRNYPLLLELSNLSNTLSAIATFNKNHSVKYGAGISFGVLYYTQLVYDTSKYEKIRTFVIKSNGKGKPGSQVVSSKQLLLSPQANGTYQVMPSIFTQADWAGGLFNFTVSYRYNIRSQIRYLAQFAGANLLSQDIYSESLSYEGPEGKIHFSNTLPFKIRITIDGLVQYQKYKAPALNLEAVEIAANRKDYRASAELSLTRYFEFSDSFGADFTLTGGLLRNLSNDDYNDYSMHSISFSIGFSF